MIDLWDTRGHDSDICDLFSHVVSKKAETIITQPAGAMREVVRIQAASPVIQAGGYAQGVTPVETASQLMNSQRHEPMPTVVRLNREVMPEWLRNVHGLLSTSPDVPCSILQPAEHHPWPEFGYASATGPDVVYPGTGPN